MILWNGTVALVLTTVVSIHIGYSRTEMKKSIQNNGESCTCIIPKKYTSGAVRQIGVSYSGFVDESYTLLSLFDDVEQIEKDNRLQTAIDVVREQFGFLAIQKGTVLTEGSRNIERSKLIGGHSAGGLEGLK